MITELVSGQTVHHKQLDVTPKQEEAHPVMRYAHPHERHCPKRPAKERLFPSVGLSHRCDVNKSKQDTSPFYIQCLYNTKIANGGNRMFARLVVVDVCMKTVLVFETAWLARIFLFQDRHE